MGIVAHLCDSLGLNVTSGHKGEAERMGLETLLFLMDSVGEGEGGEIWENGI